MKIVEEKNNVQRTKAGANGKKPVKLSKLSGGRFGGSCARSGKNVMIIYITLSTQGIAGGVPTCHDVPRMIVRKGNWGALTKPITLLSRTHV